jgi:hypothetical protein
MKSKEVRATKDAITFPYIGGLSVGLTFTDVRKKLPTQQFIPISAKTSDPSNLFRYRQKLPQQPDKIRQAAMASRSSCGM